MPTLKSQFFINSLNKYPLFYLFITALVLFIASSTLIQNNKTFAVYEGDRIIDNAVFLDANSMTATEIQDFLTSRGGGIANMSFVLNCYGPTSLERQWYTAAGAPCDQVVPASQIIYFASQIYGVNPRVILATMQKEQSLVTAANPTSWQINQAMGYGCPTTGQCGGNSTFFYQIDSGAWVLRYHYERARGNMTWWNVSSSWTCGSQKNFYSPNLYPNQNVSFYDNNGVLYRTYYLANAATSSFYCYTPHAYNNPQGLYGRDPFGTVGQYYSGSYNFVLFYELWFGSTTYLNPASFIENVPVTIVSQPPSSPAVGQQISYTVLFKNDFSYPITFEAVGAVGRAGDIVYGSNRDFGWQGPITLSEGASQQFTFTTTVVDPKNIFVWPAILHEGTYIQYNNWGSTLNGRMPNFTLSQPPSINPAVVYAGQNVTFSTVLKNNEPAPISYDALGIPVRYFNTYNYDAAWVGPGVLSPGEEIILSGTRNIDKQGPYKYWVSSYYSGVYSNIGSTNNFESLETAPDFSVSALSFSDTTPVLGENLDASFTVTNNLPVPISVDAVGVVGRYGTFTGLNRDIGWQGPIYFSAGETKTFSGYSRSISEVGTHYYWIGVLHQGKFIQYNNWGSTIISTAP